MTMTTKKKVTRRIKKGEARSNNILLFKIDHKNSLSENIEALLSELNKHRIELYSPDNYPIDDDFQQIFNINAITIMGSPYTIASDLNKIRPTLNEYILEYVMGSESLVNKFYEVTRSKYLLQQFFYDISINEPNFYDPNIDYKVHFFDNGKHKTIKVHASRIDFNADMRKEIETQFTARGKALTLLYQFLDIRLEQLRMFQYEEKAFPVPILDRRKGAQLLELWVALKEYGFLQHLKTPYQISNHRKYFFESFNLIDRNYNSNHRNLMRNKKTKGHFLKSLWDQMKPDQPKQVKIKIT